MFRFLAAVLLIVGVSVGAGMLALPMVTVGAGLLTSAAFLVLMCLFMLVLAFYVIKLVAIHPRGAHLVTIAKSTLGPWGVFVLWAANCFLLYAVLAAYISAGGDLIFNYFHAHSSFFSKGWASILFTVVMSLFVITGVRVTGVANGVLMTLKAGLYFLLVVVILLHIRVHPSLSHILNDEHPLALKTMLLVAVASFTYAMIIPSIYAYLDFNLKRLKTAVVTGTVISLIIYVLWIMTVRFVVPLHGANGLLAIAKQGSIYELGKAIGDYSHYSRAMLLSNSFISVCLLTTFLGVSLCLSDVIADGFKLRKRGWSAVVVYLFTYLPPIIAVLFFPKIFIAGVNYAGLTSIIYLIVLPALMLYFAKYKKALIPEEEPSFFHTKPVIFFILLVAVVLFVVGLMDIIAHG